MLKEYKHRKEIENMSSSIGAMGGMPSPGQNPDDFAMQYAKSKDFKYSSMEELRNWMKSQFGDPSTSQLGGGQMPITVFGGDDMMSQRAAHIGKMFINESIMGFMGLLPQGQVPLPSLEFNNSFGPQVPPETMELLAKGIPPEVIAQGDGAIRKFADENNISL